MRSLRRRHVRVAAAALLGVVVLAVAGSLVGRQIRSPAQIAAETAPPQPSLITAQVERRTLATEVIVRGTVRYGAPQDVVLPLSALKTSSSVVSSVPKPGSELNEGSIALVVSGRPVFVFGGGTPMHRDLGPGSEGTDVRQLEQALARAGLTPGPVDGRYDGATASAVATFYARYNEAPFGPTDVQADQVRTAAQTAATARDALLQMRLALRTARRGATPADLNQARLDTAAAAEAVPVARVAIATAQDKEDAARAGIEAAGLQEREATTGSGRDIAVADADVVAKRAAVAGAVDAQAQAQRDLAGAPPDTPPDELETLRAAVRSATAAVGVAQAELVAAERTAESVRAAVPLAVERARADGRRATAELRLAEAELRGARDGLAVARRKVALATARVRILRTPADTGLEREIVASARAEAARAGGVLRALALRTGVQVPADEMLFFPTLPVRVDTVAGRRGSQLAGSVMTVTNSRLAIDSTLSIADAKLVEPGQPVRIEEQTLGISTRGTVSRIADTPGTTPLDLAITTPVDPSRTYVEVLPGSAPPSLVGASVKLSIAVESTNGKVLAVPIGALSVAGDGRSRVQIDLGGGRTRYVTVFPGLAAQGFAEVSPKARLREGDRVVVGSEAPAAAATPDPATLATPTPTAAATGTAPAAPAAPTPGGPGVP